MTSTILTNDCVAVEAAAIAFVSRLYQLNPNAESWLRLSEDDKMTVRLCIDAAMSEFKR